MPSNASTDSLSDLSSIHSHSGIENHSSGGDGDLLDGDQISDEVASFFQKITTLTTRRLRAKNVPPGAAPYVYETVKKTTKTLITHSLTPPNHMLQKSRHDYTSKGEPKVARCDETDPTSFTPLHPQEAESIPVSAPPPLAPAPIYQPRVEVYTDEIPGWPVYPSSPSITSNGETAANGDMATSALPTAQPNYTAPHAQAVPIVSSALDNAAAARSSVTLATASGDLPATPMAISASQGDRLAEIPSSSSASHSRPSARGSQVRFNLIREALNEPSEP